jgi:hypothetical protein
MNDTKPWTASWGWLRAADKARVERNRIDRLNSLRRGSRRPLPAWAKAA